MKSTQFAEVVLRTSRLEAMRAWYRAVLQIEPFVEKNFESPATADRILGLCMFKFADDYPFTQMIGLFAMQDLQPKDPTRTGLDHMQLRLGSLEELFSRYELLHRAGVEPHEVWQHGPSSSCYYLDPDGNKVELNAVNFPTEQEYAAYYRSDLFARKPIGILVKDVPAYIAAVRSGVHPTRFLED